MTRTKIFTAAGTALLVAGALTGCASDAEMTSDNLSKAADQFEIERRIVFFNGITDTYLLTIEGRCAIVDEANQLEVTCKTGPKTSRKHFLGLSDNVSYFVEQTEDAKASAYHYRVIFKPESLVPSFDLETEAEAENTSFGAGGLAGAQAGVRAKRG